MLTITIKNTNYHLIEEATQPMAVKYQIVYWRDIPAQIKIRDGRNRHGRPLSDRFEKAIDQAAMYAGLINSDDYLKEWRTTEWQEREGEPDAIAEELAVSRSPIREALRILEKNRLVELTPRRGARVTELSETVIAHLCDILAALLGLTALQCVENGSTHDLNNINHAAKACEQYVNREDVYGYYKSVFDFAIACLKATGNPLLEQMVEQLMPNVRRILYASFSTQKEALQKNVEIVLTGNRFVQMRNGPMAQKTVCDYVRKAKEFALKNKIFAIP